MCLVQAVPFLESFSSTDEVYDNQAEWLTAVMVKSERQNQGPELAAKFAGSQLKANADKLIDAFVSTTDEADVVTREELAVTTATVTPNWFAFKTLIKVWFLRSMGQTSLNVLLCVCSTVRPRTSWILDSGCLDWQTRL